MLGNASFRTSMHAKEIHELIATTGITIAYDIVSIPATIIALVLVGKIYEMQMSHAVRRI
jgi:ketol-acid reductoisomerase